MDIRHTRSETLRSVLRAIADRARALCALPAATQGDRAAQWRERVFPLRVRHLSGPRDVTAHSEEVVVVCLVRDGAAYLDDFLRHYRALGAIHIVLLDNGSTDGTVERAVGESGVTVLRTEAPYGAHKVIAKRFLVRRFGKRNWVLCVDIDEFFDYPHRERLPLRDFLAYLNEKRYSAVVAHLLDLFPRGALSSGAPAWRTEHRYYDLSAVDRQPYREKYGDVNYGSNEQIVVQYGGIRQAQFGVRPMLTKHPLQFPAAGVHMVNSHNVRGARIADVSAVLLHYKYVPGFVAYAERIVRERSFYRESLEYRSYLEAIQRDPHFSLYSEQARVFRSADQLVEEGFLAAPAAFQAWVNAASQRPPSLAARPVPYAK